MNRNAIDTLCKVDDRIRPGYRVIAPADISFVDPQRIDAFSHACLEQIMDQAFKGFCLDFGEVETINSYFFGYLLRINDAHRGRFDDSPVGLVTGADVYRMLRGIKLDTLFACYPSVDAYARQK